MGVEPTPSDVPGRRSARLSFRGKRASGRSRTDLLRLTRTALPHGSFTGMEPPVGADPTLPRYKGGVRAGEGGVERMTGLEPATACLEGRCSTSRAPSASAGALPLHHQQLKTRGPRCRPGLEPGPPAESAHQDSNLGSSAPKADGMTKLPYGQSAGGMASTGFTTRS